LLAVWGYGAQSASASGLTAVECVNVGEGEYNNTRCATPKAPGDYQTVVIEGKQAVEGVSTREISETQHELGSTANPVAVFHGTPGGVNTTVTCGTGNTTGASVENKEEGGEMKIHVTQAVDLWTECHASPEAQPTKICNVKGVTPKTPVGLLQTNRLTAITGPKHKVTVTPEEGTTFIQFSILKKGEEGFPECFTGSTIPVTVTGEALGEADTTTHSHLTIQEPWPCGGAEQPACGGVKANNTKVAQTETITGFTKGTETLIGAETF